jgi:quercetin dioxygenase-like cupin family protein
MPKIEAQKKDALAKAPSTPGIQRELAFADGDHRVIRSRTEPGAVSGWHHHGEYDIFGYVVSGTARFESASAGGEATIVGPGDFFHVPRRTVHREINPSSTEGQEIILFLRGSGPMVINVDGPG